MNREHTAWPKADDFKRTIRYEFSFYIAVIILLLMLVTGYLITKQYVDTVSSNVIEKQLAQARSYSSSSGKLILSTNGPDMLLLNNICQKLSDENEDIYWCGITDTSNQFIAHIDIKKVVKQTYAPNVEETNIENILKNKEKVSYQKDTITIIVPIIENRLHLGNLVMTASTKEIDQAKMKSIKTVLFSTVLMILIGIPFTIFLLSKKLRPIKTITSSLQNMDYDKFDIEIPVINNNEFGFLSETLNVMGSKLQEAQKEQFERERLTREFEIANEIQSKILPKEYPCSEKFEFACMYRSAKEVGGDYYDFIEHDSDHLGILIADVSGKSLPGMLIMLLTRDIVRNLSRVSKDPAHILTMTNEHLIKDIKKGMFVTMFYGVLSKSTGIFEFASAGHNPLILMDVKSGEYDLIKTKGYPLGLMPTDQFAGRIEKQYVKLDTEKLVIQYTDGINEAKNNESEEFGMQRFIDVITNDRNLPPQNIIENTIQSQDKFIEGAEQYDDITLLVMKWNNREKKNIYINKKEGTNVS